MTRPTHIGLNAQLLSLASSYRSAGVSGYIEHLLQHLPGSGSGHRFTAFTGERRWEPPRGMEVAWTRWPTGRPAARIVWEQVAQPFLLAGRHIDLAHGLAYVAPALWSGPSVVTVLDLSFILFPERFRPLNRIYLRLFTRLSARRAARVIVISENTRRDAVRLLGLDAQKVAVVYCGVESSLRPHGAEELQQFRRTKGLPARFVLFIGTLEPRKNILGLIDAYAILKARWDQTAGDLPALVIAGAKGWYYDEVFRRVDERGLGASVRFAGYVPAEELSQWYAAAELFVYPSLYEGFGLPALEAMACGTAVVTSNCSSLPEVVGDAGVMVDPDDPEQLAQALWELLRDDAMRETYRERGRQRAAMFSWQRAARETLAVYDQILGREG